jgi:hypothetical protein
MKGDYKIINFKSSHNLQTMMRYSFVVSVQRDLQRWPLLVNGKSKIKSVLGVCFLFAFYLFMYIFETGSCYVAQISLKLNPPISASQVLVLSMSGKSDS